MRRLCSSSWTGAEYWIRDLFLSKQCTCSVLRTNTLAVNGPCLRNVIKVLGHQVVKSALSFIICLCDSGLGWLRDFLLANGMRLSQVTVLDQNFRWHSRYPDSILVYRHANTFERFSTKPKPIMDHLIYVLRNLWISLVVFSSLGISTLHM